MTFTPLRPGVPDLDVLLAGGRDDEKDGRLDDAASAYERVIAAADEATDARVLAEALRRLGGIRRRRHELVEAEALSTRSLAVAESFGDPTLIAEALNGCALVQLVRGDWDAARKYLHRALHVAGDHVALRPHIEQNLGTMANVEGDLDAALAHYERSLVGFSAVGEPRGCARALNNIGMNQADRQLWAEADTSFRASLELAEQTGDVQLRGLALLNRTEVLIARQDFEAARRSAEEALRVFDQLGAPDHKADAYKWLGVLYRETGRTVLAEARIKAALEISSGVGATLVQAEATRELAVLYGQLGRNQETLKLFSAAHRLFGRLNARRDLVDVGGKVQQLEALYLEIVRQWGASLESSDTYTYGHSSRVAEYAEKVAVAMGLAGTDLTAIRVGAHLHDIGKIRVPHEILNKPGKLTNEEFDVMKQHPVYGIEMLAAIDFPWDVRPVIRSHHEKLDGTGYPDRLRGDEIALAAQIACVSDVYDALTTTRSYRGAMALSRARGIMEESRHWWRPDVYDAFLAAVAEPDAEAAAREGRETK